MSTNLEASDAAVAAYLEHFGVPFDAQRFANTYAGHWDSEWNYAQNYVTELLPPDAPEFLADYFDYEAFTHDLFISKYVSVEAPTGVFVFRNDSCEKG